MNKNELNGKVIYSNDMSQYTYADYLEMCNDMDITPCADGSREYNEWLSDEMEIDYHCLFDNLRYSWANNRMWVINGSCGLWCGRRKLIPLYFNSLKDAFNHILNVGYDNITTITYEDGKIHITQSHHDGKHSFDLLLVREYCEDAVQRFCDNEGIYEDMKKGWFQNIKGYIF